MDLCSEVLNRRIQPLHQRDLWTPVQLALRKRNIWSPLRGVVRRQFTMHELGVASYFRQHDVRQLPDAEFAGIAQVHGPGECLILYRHHSHHAFDKVVHVAEGSCLAPVTVDGNVLASQCLADEVGHDASVLRVHLRSVGVKDTDDADGDALVSVVIKEKTLGAAFALIVAGTNADGVDVSPVGFFLWALQRFAVHL